MRDLVGVTPAGDDPAARTRRVAEPATPPAWVPGADPARADAVGAAGGRHSPAARTGRRLRWDPGPRAIAALGLAVLVVVAAAAWWLLTGRPSEAPVTAVGPTGSAVVPVGSSGPASAPSSAPTTVPASSAASSAAGTLVVDVAGKVRSPGIYELPGGARVFDALRAAGGAKPGVSTLSLNLAQVLHDGEQIVVGAPAGAPVGAPSAAGGASGGGTSPATAVDLNSATLEQLETLPGVGPVLGQNILDWRDAHGRFASVDQLSDVSGIGDVRLAQLRPLVSV